MPVTVKRTASTATGRLDPEVARAAVAVLAPLGLRLTRHRSAVLSVLASTDRPLTTDEVSDRSGVPTSTVYRNVAELADAGVLARVGGADRLERYELAESYSQRHHHHLVCEQCGAVIDFDPSPKLERLIAQELAAVQSAAGFRATQHVFDVRGVCANCS